jgi:hypothetical protein
MAGEEEEEERWPLHTSYEAIDPSLHFANFNVVGRGAFGSSREAADALAEHRAGVMVQRGREEGRWGEKGGVVVSFGVPQKALDNVLSVWWAVEVLR